MHIDTKRAHTGSECVLDSVIGEVRYEDMECVHRPFNHGRGWRPPGPIEVANGIINTPLFHSFSNLLKSWHGLVHNRIRGTMGNLLYSPFDPLFFLHHTMVDKIFATWQVTLNKQDLFWTAQNDDFTLHTGLL